MFDFFVLVRFLLLFDFDGRAAVLKSQKKTAFIDKWGKLGFGSFR